MSRAITIRNRVKNEVRHTYEKIYPKPTQGLFNYRCFENSVQYSLNSEKPLRIFEVIYIDGDYPILHYLVKDELEFLEVTIGWRAEYVEYFLIREIPKDDWKCIGSIFEDAEKYWHHKYTNWFDRTFFNVDRVV